MNREVKLTVSLASLSFAGGALFSHTIGTLFPALPLAFTIAVLAVVSNTAFNRIQATTGVAIVACFAIVYRIYAYLFPPSMMRFDPDAHAVRSQVIVSTGGLDNIIPGFYQTAAAFNIFGAEVSLITGTSVDTAFVVYPLIVGLTLPLFAAILARRVANDGRAAIIAAAVVAVGAPSTKFAIAPIPITLAAIYIAGSIVAISLFRRKLDRIYLFILVILGTAAAFTHKIPLLLIILFAGVLAVYTGVVEWKKIQLSKTTETRIIAFGAFLLVLQWVYLSDYIVNAVYLLLGIWGDIGSWSTIEKVSPSAAVFVDPPLLVKVSYHLYFLLTVGVGGIAAMDLFRRYYDWNVRTLQAAAAVTVGIALPGLFFSSAPGFQRVYIYGTVFVAALVGVGAIRLVQFKRPVTKYASILLVLAILITNPLSVIAMPDHPGTYRQYLTADEVEGKYFAGERIPDTVYMDLFYGDEVIDFPRAASEDEWHQQTVPNPQWNPGLLSHELTEGTLLKQDYKYVALRTNIDIYRLKDGRYRLTWHPEQALDSSYHRVYSNGGSVIYRNPSADNA